jgi:hypothetical protein
MGSEGIDSLFTGEVCLVVNPAFSGTASVPAAGLFEALAKHSTSSLPGSRS